jgi:thiamine-monophosphate kinase
VKEPELLALLRTLPLHPGALGLADDAARLGDLVLTTDVIVEGVHFLATDPPADVAWKLVAVNLSDLAAKGATPEGVMLGFPLSDDTWDRAFVEGLREALSTFACPLLGGDTVRGPRVLSLTAIGVAKHAPTRSGARPGDALWVTGTIGDAGAGLVIAQGKPGPDSLLSRYRRPIPRLAEGRALAPHVHAMMDVSDGLLLDAARLAEASGCAVTIQLDAVPISDDARAFGVDVMTAATAGDDYELLFALPPDTAPPVPATRVGTFGAGKGLTLVKGSVAVPLPERLGFTHG